MNENWVINIFINFAEFNSGPCFSFICPFYFFKGKFKKWVPKKL